MPLSADILPARFCRRPLLVNPEQQSGVLAGDLNRIYDPNGLDSMPKHL